ncbi:MAG: DegQ family serine endoprotease [Pseudomonadota bacterium]
MLRTLTFVATRTLVLLALLGSTALLSARELPDFTTLVKESAAAVVNISTKKTTQSGRKPKGHEFTIPDLPDDSPFHDFLERFFGDDFQLEDVPEFFDAESLGSGFIISADGYVLTNHHVVKGADEIVVRLSDRREFVATLVGSDKATDVALIKIDAGDLPTANLGSSSDLQVGEWVLAIGSPFGFDHSVTAGIVSAKGRSLPTENYVPFIQTDVAVNPGNSGGPLFNLDGEVVGVNSQIYSRTGGFMGLSFAIPIDVAKNVADQLRTKGRVSRGWLGVLIQDVTRELAESFGMDQPRGALVAKVLEESPSEAAGIRVGDVILTFNGKKVERSSQLPPMVGAADIDRPAQVEVLREGQLKTFSVKIGELPEREALQAGRGVEEPPNRDKRFGVMVSDLTDEQREALDVAEGGVYVEHVVAGPAASAGIEAGDVILMVNNQGADSARQFLDLLEELPAGKTIAVLVHRDGGSRFLALKTPKE